MNSQIMELPVEDVANIPSNKNVVNMLSQVSEQPTTTQYPLNRLSRQTHSEEEGIPANSEITFFGLNGG